MLSVVGARKCNHLLGTKVLLAGLLCVLSLLLCNKKATKGRQEQHIRERAKPHFGKKEQY
jgi:hypothetical protein